MYTYIHIYTYIYIYVSLFMCVCMRVHVCVCVCVHAWCVYVYMFMFVRTGQDLNRCWARPDKMRHPEIYHAKKLLAELPNPAGGRLDL